jgi:enediyne biosynthesis protein E4
MLACQTMLTRSSKRKYIAISLVIMILSLFWGISRYPDLMSEYHKTQESTLTERNAGALSKDQVLDAKTMKTNTKVIVSTIINWLDTNKIGMSFGILFSTAILLLLEQSAFFYKRAAKSGLKGVFTGILLGIPMGVCTNCATPVSLGMKKAGASYESAFATLIASPALNPIGLAMIFMIFPISLGVYRTLLILGFLLIILPLLKKLMIHEPQSSPHQPLKVMELDESWQSAFSYSVKNYWRYLCFIIRRVLPPMIVIGMLAAIAISFFPLEQLTLIEKDSIKYIIIAGIIGSLLPMPMFVDIVIVAILLEFGLPLSIATTLLVTLAPTSCYAMYVMGKNVSWKLSVSITCSIAIMGILAGIAVHSSNPFWQSKKIDSSQIIGKYSQFMPIKSTQIFQLFDNKSLDNFFAGGVSTIDFDNDGNIDIFIPGNKGNRLLKNLGNGQFTEVGKYSGISNQYNSVAGIWGDFDNDGYIDLYLVNYKNDNGKAEPNILYRNNKNGTFTDVSSTSGLNDKDFSSSAAWADYDNDGDLDLFVSNYGVLKVTGNAQITGSSQHDRLYRNDDGRFVDVSKHAKIAGKKIQSNKLRQIELSEQSGNRGFSFQPVWFDYDNDNLIDLFVTSDFGTSQLYKNNGDGTFTNVTRKAKIDKFTTGMGVAVVDINQDGYFDLYITTTTKNKLYINNQDGTFYERAQLYQLSDAKRTGWGVASIDIDNNGEEEFFIVNGAVVKSKIRMTIYEETLNNLQNINSLLIRDGKHFKQRNRIYNLFNSAMGRGLAIADLNNDGHVDIIMTSRDKDNLQIYQNSGNDNTSLSIQLVGNKNNKMAVGAKVSVYVNGKVQHKLVSAGSSYLSQHSQVLHFGTNRAAFVDKIVITWPDGTLKQMKNVATKQKLIIEEGN